jgi:hypothetical protein
MEYFIYQTDSQLDCSKNYKVYIKIYMRGAATCFGFSQPSSGSYCMCFDTLSILITLAKHLPDDGCEKPKHVVAPLV